MAQKRLLLLTVLVTLLVTGSLVVYLAVQEKRVYDPELFGIGEPIAFRHIAENLDIDRSFEALRQLGARRLREWIWMGSFLENESVVNSTFEKAMGQVILQAQASNITIMGMSHDFPSWMTDIENDSQAVPIRNTTTGSNYMLFLERYRTSWKTIAQTFQNITAWEIGNEFNSDEFLHPQGFNESASGSPHFSIQEKADITTDLLYYGSLGISEGNPKATRILGGLAPCPNIADIEVFLKGIYANIWSGQWPSVNPDDYFQEVNWHPYLQDAEPNESNWVSPNKAIHNVMKEYGDEEKRVIFSEFGYSDENVSQETVKNHLLKAFQLAKDDFPWLETIYWFRLIDPTPHTISKVNPLGFGLMNLDWTWKPAAYAYQSLTQKSRDSFNSCLLTFLGVTANDWNKTITETSDAFKTRTLQISEAGET